MAFSTLYQASVKKTQSIAIVEDENLAALCSKATVLKAGYDVFGIYSRGEDLIADAAQKRPDLVLMDISLRGKKDGIETARYLGAEYGLPVIFVTAHSDDDTILRACGSNSYGYIIKPFSRQSLKAAIRTAFASQSGRVGQSGQQKDCKEGSSLEANLNKIMQMINQLKHDVHTEHQRKRLESVSDIVKNVMQLQTQVAVKQQLDCETNNTAESSCKLKKELHKKAKAHDLACARLKTRFLWTIDHCLPSGRVVNGTLVVQLISMLFDLALEACPDFLLFEARPGLQEDRRFELFVKFHTGNTLTPQNRKDYAQNIMLADLNDVTSSIASSLTEDLGGRLSGSLGKEPGILEIVLPLELTSFSGKPESYCTQNINTGNILAGAVVLLAEKDLACADELAGTLEDCGAMVCRANDMRKAVELFYTHFPDVVILDGSIKQPPGISLVSIIASTPASKRPAVIGMIHESDCSNDSLLCLDDFMSKPVAITTLVQKTAVQYCLKSFGRN